MKSGSKTESLILKLVEKQAPVIWLDFSADGILEKANHYAREKLVLTVGQSSFDEVFALFDDQKSMKELTDSQDPQLISVNIKNDLPRSFTFHFEATENGVLAFGWPIVEELEILRKKLLRLSNEVGDLNRALQKKIAELERSNRLKNQFLGMAAHDLRNPIWAINNYSDFLLDVCSDLADDLTKKNIQSIHSLSNGALKLIDGFLDIAMIESGAIELEVKPTDLNETIESVLSVFTSNSDLDPDRINIVIGKDFPKLQLDGPKFEQALINLIDNGFEHGQKDTVISIRAFIEKPFVKIAISDNGPGIPKQKLANLFSPGAHRKEKKVSGKRSTGLGLVIVKKIIEAHNGTVQVDSTTGKGTTFTLELKLTPMEKGR